MNHDRPLRILHAPQNVGNHPACLAAAERELGYDSRCVTLVPTVMGYEGGKAIVSREASVARQEAARLQILWEALRWADVVHLNFGSTVLPPDTAATPPAHDQPFPRRVAVSSYHVLRRLTSGRELRWFRAAGKTIAVTYQGNDIRPSWSPSAPAGQADPDRDRRRSVLAQAFDRHAHVIYALNPDLLGHLPDRASFLPYASVDIGRITPVAISNHDDLVVAHAPTNRASKGTAVVIEAVDRLRHKGFRVRLDLIERAAHAEVLERLARADVVVDQVRIGWYGGFAVEAMALGRPVVVFIEHRDLARVPSQMALDLPLVRVERESVESLAAGLSRLLADSDLRYAVGSRSRSFVERWHDPLLVARTTTDSYLEARKTRR